MRRRRTAALTGASLAGSSSCELHDLISTSPQCSNKYPVSSSRSLPTSYSAHGSTIIGTERADGTFCPMATPSATSRTLRRISRGRSWGLYREAEAEEAMLPCRATCQHPGRESSDAAMQEMLCRIRQVRRKEHTRRWSYGFGLWSALATLT